MKHPNELMAYNTLAEKCTKIKLVLPPSVEHKRICFVGEALGEREELNSVYFHPDAPAGKTFDKLLREVGIIRDSVHVTNVVKIKPPDNKIPELSQLGLSVDDFIPYLKEELQTVAPKIIVALGATAMEALTGLSGISKQRGTVTSERLTGCDIPTMITVHPAYLARGQWGLYVFVRADIKTAVELGFKIREPMRPYTIHTDPTLTEAIDFLCRVNASTSATCIDIETVAHQRITCVGFSISSTEAMTIPFRHNGMHNRWAEHEQLMILSYIRDIWRNPKLTKIGQNFWYDVHYLLPLLGFPREPIFDTMHAHSLIHPDARHDLGFLMSSYSDMPYHKEDFKDWASKDIPKDSQLWEYNARDCIGTHRVYDNLYRDLNELGYYDFFTGYIMPLRRVLFEMEWRGVRINTEEKSSWARFIEEEELPIAQDILNRLTGKDINPNSSKQVGGYLESIGIPIPRTEKGNFTVDEDKLDELSARLPNFRLKVPIQKARNIMQQIICTRQLKAKTLGTYLSARVSSDGRMRCTFDTTKTGRLSSKSNHRDEGTNLQNQPKHLRTYFIPDEGHKFLCPDLVGAEAFVMVYQMKSEKLKQRMNAGEKIHAVVAQWIDNKSVKDLTPERYRDIKSVVHGSNYKMGINKFATTIGKTVAEAKILRDKYYSIVPELPTYHNWVENELDTKRQLTTCYGRVRVHTGMLDSKSMYSYYAQIPQSTVADTINIGMLGLWLIKPDDIHLLIQVHDEVVISCPINRIDWFIPYIQHHLCTLRELWIEDDLLIIPVDIGAPRDSWYESKGG